MIIIPEIISEIKTKTTRAITITLTTQKTEIVPYTISIIIPEQLIVPKEGSWALHFFNFVCSNIASNRPFSFDNLINRKKA